MDKYGTMHPHGYNMIPATDRAAGKSRKGYDVERTITVKESVTYYRKGKPALKLTRVYRETRRGRRLGLPSSNRPRLPR